MVPLKRSAILLLHLSLNKIIAGKPLHNEIVLSGIEPAADKVRLSLFFWGVKTLQLCIMKAVLFPFFGSKAQ